VSLAHGGLERLVVDWTNERNARCPGSTWVICLDEAGELAPFVRMGRVEVVDAQRSRSPWDRKAVGRLRDLLTRTAPVDIVHSHNTAARQYAGLAVRRTRIRHVHTEHGTNVYARGLRNRLRNAVLSRLTHRTVAVSADTAAALADAGIAARESVTVIPKGVDVGDKREVSDLRSQNAREGFGIAPESVVVGSVGRLAAVKGYDRLLRAFASITPTPRYSHPLTLLLIGDGPERGALEALAEELGIADRVVFAGYREDARALLGLFSLFVLPSRSEGLSVALLEAMAEGVPVAVTDVGENRGILDGGNCGVILPDDEREWGRIVSDQLSVITDQSAEVRGRVERARERVAEHYSLAATLDAYEHVYADVMRDGR